MATAKAGELISSRAIEVTFGPQDIIDAIKAKYGDRIVGEIQVQPPTMWAGAAFIAMEPENGQDVAPEPTLTGGDAEAGQAGALQSVHPGLPLLPPRPPRAASGALLGRRPPRPRQPRLPK